jgi:hypothetical protein
MDDLGAVTIGGYPAKPSIRKLCDKRTGVRADVMGVDEVTNDVCQYDKNDRDYHQRSGVDMGQHVRENVHGERAAKMVQYPPPGRLK